MATLTLVRLLILAPCLASSSKGKGTAYIPHSHSCQPGDLQCSLRGRNISVAFNHYIPYLYLTKEYRTRSSASNRILITPQNVHENQLAGVEAELIKSLCTRYEITFDLKRYKLYGGKLRNGTWTEKFAPLAAREVDMVAACIPGNHQKHQIGRHSAPMYYYQFKIVSIKDSGGLLHVLAPLLPFQPAVWVGISISVLAIGFFVWLLACLHAWLWHLRVPHGLSLITVTLLVGQILIGATKSWRWTPNESSKLLVSIWLLAALILQCSYSSKLIVSYSMQRNPESPEIVEDIMRLGKTVVIVDGGTPMAMLRQYGNTIKTKVYHGHIFPRYLTDSSTVTMYNPNAYVFEILADGRRPLTNFHFSRKPVLSVFSGWLYSRQFKLSGDLDHFILRAAQAGLLDKWHDDQFRTLRKYRKILEGRENEVEQCDIEHTET